MSSQDENKGKERAKKAAVLSAELLKVVKEAAEKKGLNSSGLTDKIDEIESVVSAIDTHEPPKKLDWIVFAGFAIFMIAIIGAVFGQSIRWLAAAFLIMPIVIMFGLLNNVKNMQPNWDEGKNTEGNGIELNLPNAPQSLKKAYGQGGRNPQSKRQYWFMIVLVGMGASFFFVMGLFLLFSEAVF